MAKKAAAKKQVKRGLANEPVSFFDRLIDDVKSDRVGPTVALLEALERLTQRVEEIQGGMESEGKQTRAELMEIKEKLEALAPESQ